MQGLPHPGRAPVAPPPPAGHPGAAAEPPRQGFPADPGAQHDGDAVERRPVGHAGPTPLGLGGSGTKSGAIASRRSSGTSGVGMPPACRTAMGFDGRSVSFDPGSDHPLPRSLPPLVYRRSAERDDALGATVRHLAGEVARRQPGAQAMVDRLVDVLFVHVLRARLDRPLGDRPGSLGALRDPLIGRALALVHPAPGRRWTVAALGGEAGFSRAALSRRFGDAVGGPPMACLARWRLTVAADLLRGGEEPPAAIADRLRSESAFAFSQAFTRLRGQAPGRSRVRARR